MSTTPEFTGFEGLKVLVADDHPVNLEVACALLDAEHIEVDAVGSGLEAVEHAARRTYDLILMDVQMPVMDGMTAARSIHATPVNARTPIIAMTGDARDDDRRRCAEAGMIDCLLKPFDPEDLLFLIRKWACPVSQPLTSEPRPQQHDGPRVHRYSDPDIDLAHANELFRGMPERYDELLRHFVEHSTGNLQLLRRQTSTTDTEAACRTCHSLRGAAWIVGAARLGALLEDLEEWLRDGLPAEAIEALMEDIEAAHRSIAARVAQCD